MVHPAQLIEAPSPCSIACSAVATIVESIDIMRRASETVVNTRPRRTSGVRRGNSPLLVMGDANAAFLLRCRIPTYPAQKPPRLRSRHSSPASVTPSSSSTTSLLEPSASRIASASGTGRLPVILVTSRRA